MSNQYHIFIVFTILYSLIFALLFTIIKKYRLALFICYCLTAPPFVDYELAIIAKTAYRSAFYETTLRPEITQPIFSIIDFYLILLIAFDRTSRLRIRNQSKLDNNIKIALMLFMIFSIISGVISWNIDQQKAIFVGISNVFRTILVMLLIYYRRNEITNKIFWYIIMLGINLLCLESILVTLVKYRTISFGSIQFTGLIPGPGGIGNLLILLLPIPIYILLKYRNNIFQYIFSLFTLIIIIIYIIGTLTRSTYLGLLALFVIISIPIYKRSKRIFFLSYLILASLFISAYSRIDKIFLDKINYTIHSDYFTESNLGSRLIYWKDAIDLIKIKPIFGIGPSMWGYYSIKGTNTHQIYLQQLVEYGLLSFLAWIYIIYYIIKNIINNYKRINNDLIFIISGILCFLLTQLFSSTLSNYRALIIFWCILWIGFFMSNKRHE